MTPSTEHPGGARLRPPAWPQQADAHLESSIPARFLRIIDLTVIALSFCVALFAAPWLQELVAPGGALRVDGLQWLVFPSETFTGLHSVAGGVAALCITAGGAVAAIEALGGYRGLSTLSTARIVASAVAGPIAGLSAFTLVVFGLRANDEWSRVFLFTHAGCSIAGLVGYRIGST